MTRETSPTEHLLVSRDGFDITTASPAQRAACHILDGVPLPGYLRSHPDVAALVGGPEALDALPSERGVAPVELVFLAAIRSAKTIIACAAAIRMTQTVDVSRLGPGEVPRVSLLSLRLDQAAVAHRLLLETVRASRVLRPLLISETADSLVVRHPSGRPIEIACVAGSRAGGTLVARWSAGLVADEAPRMSGADDAVVNLEHARSAILGRLLPGAQALYIGSPWAPHGPVYDLVQQHWERPTDAMVVLRGTGPMLNPTWFTPERCARLRDSDPVAWTTDVEGDFADPEAGLLSPIAIARSTRESPVELERDREHAYVAAVDPSEGAARGNGFALVIVAVRRARPAKREWDPWPIGPDGERYYDAHAAMMLRRQQKGMAGPPPEPQVDPDAVAAPQRRYRVALAREWRGLSPDHCWREITKICKSYGIDHVWSDQYAASANLDLAKRYGLHVRKEVETATKKLESWTDVATLVHTDQVELSPEPIFQRDLRSVKKRVTQSGMTIVYPRVDGRHCDLAAAFCAAMRPAQKAINTDPYDGRTIRFSGRWG